MSNLITDEMVEAALEGSYDPPKEPGRTFLNRDAYRSLWAHHMRAALEAAAPLIAAKALKEAADALEALPSAAVGYGRYDSIGARKGRARQDERGVIGHWLRARADRIERGES